jgi:hypothetical protein
MATIGTEEMDKKTHSKEVVVIPFEGRFIMVELTPNCWYDEKTKSIQTSHAKLYGKPMFHNRGTPGKPEIYVCYSWAKNNATAVGRVLAEMSPIKKICNECKDDLPY